MMRALMTKTLFVLSILLSAQALAFDVDGLSYDVINTTDVEVTGRAAGNTDTDIVIPATVSDGSTTYSVAAIEGGAFFANALTSVSMPGSVTNIEDGAFNSNALTSVIIPDSVTTIGDYSFGNNALASVTIGNSVTSIGYAAFNNNALVSVTIPDSVTSIAGAAFILNALTGVIIPDSVTSIGVEGPISGPPLFGRGFTFANNSLTSAAFLGDFGTFDLDMFEKNRDLATITYAQGASGWDAPLRTFTPDTGPTGSVTAEAAAAPPASPATPAAPTATAGDSQASVTWTKPADGGSTITGYTLTSAPDGKTCTTSNADTLTCDVTGLTNGTAYTFSVTATNGVGTSAASAESSSVTPAAPPVPPVPTVATPVPTSPLWILGVMAGLLSLVAVRKLRKV
jgi:hypothetical protein